ncbi:MAG: FtsX-like permease family protein [Chloroflexi bacterium]|nr:FtsX-like permease family protein [Chloroflexota bacterium]
MDSLFGVPLTSIMIGLLLLTGLAVGTLGWVVWRHPLLVRMGLRNIRRRRAQTLLIVMGLMLSTLIVSAAFATGDTVGYSITNTIYAQLEEVDFLVSFREDASQLDRPKDFTEAGFLEQVRAAFGNDPDIDGITGSMTRPLPVLNPRARLSDPAALVVGVDPATVDSFKGLREPGSGQLVSAAPLTGDRVYITERLAKRVDGSAGGRVDVYFGNRPHRFEVLGVVRDSSVTAQGGTTVGGVVMNLERLRELTGEPGALSNIVISLRGGTRGTIDLIDPVQDRLEVFLEQHPGSGARIAFTKEELVAIGELAGSVFVTFFLVFGLFSMAAGILLIFLIFVMLAAERRSEMGMARAIGMNRLHLTQTFVAEGMAYNIGSALVGALLGLAVSGALIFAMSRIVSDVGVSIAFHFNPVGFVIAYAAGVVVTFATVAFASWRAANLNIVRAIRDLPEPQLFRTQRPSVGALLRSAVGALWYLGWIALVAIWAVAAFQLFIFGLAFYGLPFLAGIPAVALYVFGARHAAGQRLWLPERRGRRVAWIALLVVAFPVALISYAFRVVTGRARTLRARRLPVRVLFVLWWVAFSLMALVTWLLFRSRGWANRHRGAGGWALLMLLTGVLFVYLGGWVWAQAFAYTGGATLAVLAVAMLAVYFGAAARAAFTIAGGLLVWYWLLPLPFSLISEAGRGWGDPVAGLLRLLPLPGPKELSGQIEMFFVSGVSITAAATLVIIFNATALLSVLTALGRALGGLVPAIRTAIAYPLAARFRTAMTLSMFGLVVFSLVVMAFLNFNFTQLFLGEDARAGFDVHAWSNADNRVPDLRAALAESDPAVIERIAGIGTAISAFPLAEQSGVTASTPTPEPPQPHRLIGADAEFYRLARLPLAFRATGYASDAAVFEAIQRDSTLVVASDEILRRQNEGFGGPPQDDRLVLNVSPRDLEKGPWEPIAVTLRDAKSGRSREVRVIGFLESQVTGVLVELAGIYTTRESVAGFAAGGERENFFLTTKDPSKGETERLAKAIESALLERGVQADSIQATIDETTAQSTAFQLLFEGFMGLGLIVGIAALGVIAFRTVVERRQQIGMLRAIGYTRRLIGLSFFLESSFIALTGIGMGLVLGWALSYNLLSSPELVGASGVEIDFRVPWVRLLLIGGIAYGASALMTLIPVRSASRVAVAEALRYE